MFASKEMLRPLVGSTGVILFSSGSEVKAKAYNASAEEFSLTRKCLSYSKLSNYFNNSRITFRYASIRSFFVLNSPLYWFTTSKESQDAITCRAFTPLASRRLAISALYSGLLLEALKFRQKD